MKQGFFDISVNEMIAKNIYTMVLEGDTSDIGLPGQFVNIELDGFQLRRPMSVCDFGPGFLRICYKIAGAGTEVMSTMKPGEKLDLLTGLGNGFDTSKAGDKPLLIGGGMGVTPLYGLCKKLIKEGAEPSIVMGFNSTEEIILKEQFEDLGVPIYISTVDGSVGVKGFVTDAMKGLDYTYFFACGPTPMSKAVWNTVKTSGQFSFEARMGCGFGACMSCSLKTTNGAKRVCKDGPVFIKEEVIW